MYIRETIKLRKMTTKEFQLPAENFTMSANYYAPRSHYKFIMSLSRVFPCTREQAKNFVQLDVLNSKDVEIVEAMLNKHGFVGAYKFTKSETWVRLQNNSDLIKALKLEYNF